MKMETPLTSLYEKVAQDAMCAAGKETLALAREKSPTDTGASDKTGFVVIDDLTVQVGFASFISRLNHENLDRVFPSGGEPKFLENAALAVDIEAIAAAKLREATGG